MRVFVTGASGFIGSAVVPELIGAGHEVVGLARNDDSAAKLTAAGAEVHRGSLDDPASLAAGAAAADGVIHLAYHHDFSDMAGAAVKDRAAITAIGEALEGTGRPFVIASGLLGLAPGEVSTEHVVPDAGGHPRVAAAALALSFAERGVRSSVVRLAPSVHDEGDYGFVPMIIGIARDKGSSGYIGDGANRWPAVHRRDAASLFRLALEEGKPGSVFHAAGDEGVPIRDIAEVIGRQLGLPVVSIAPDDAAEHFGWMAPLLAMDAPASSKLTQQWLGWTPTHAGLIEDLQAGHYFQPIPA